MKYELCSGYRDNAILRNEYNRLVGGRFGIDFETWYQDGFWGEMFDPYTLFDGGKAISSISVNHMLMTLDGVNKHYIQLGGVTTADEYQRQGLSRYIMEKIISEYKDHCDGIYLFANDTVTEFYPKFGFEVSEQYRYFKSISGKNCNGTYIKVDMDRKENHKKLISAIKSGVSNERFHTDNIGLLMFYAAGVLKEQVYFLPELSAYVVAEIEEGTLLLHQVIAPRIVELEDVIDILGGGCSKVVLGFTPLSNSGFEKERMVEADCTYFIRGEDQKQIEKKSMMFPMLSHA